MKVLSEKDIRFFEENGYVIVPEAAPHANLDAAVDAVWEFLGMDRNNPDDWYREPHTKGGMVEIYQHQALWNNRQYPRIHAAFADLFGDEKLWVSFDRAAMKPPSRPDRPDWEHKGFLHWDVDVTKLPIPFGVQGVLYLTDTQENQGGFQCVPGIHRRLEQWIPSQPNFNPRKPDLTGLEIRKVAGKAGDLLIWHRGLLHGNGHNTSNSPRLAQYILMFPAKENDEAAREQRIELWRERRHPPGFPGDPRQWEQKQGKTAELSPLGRKLLGLDRW